MNVSNYLTLCRSIFTHPNWAFDQIIKRRLITAAVITWLIIESISFLTWCIILRQGSHAGPIAITSTVIYFFLLKRLIRNVLLILLGVFLENILAKGYYKFKSSYLNLLACTLFINLLTLPMLGGQIITAYLFPTGLAEFLVSVLLFIFLVWFITLKVKALKHVYDSTTGPAVAIMLFSMAVMLTLYLIDPKMFLG